MVDVDTTSGGFRDLRRHPRRRCAQPVRVRCDSWNRFINLVAHNVSRGGIFVATSAPPAPGTKVDLKLDLHGPTFTGRVTHVDPASVDQARGMGIQFVDLDRQRREVIARLVAEARLPAPSPEGGPEPEAKPASEPKAKSASEVEPAEVEPAEVEPASEVAPEPEGEMVAMGMLLAELARLKKLGVHERLGGEMLNADRATVRRAFRAASARFHPDRFARYASAELKQLAEEVYLLLNETKRALAGTPASSPAVGVMRRARPTPESARSAPAQHPAPRDATTSRTARRPPTGPPAHHLVPPGLRRATPGGGSPAARVTPTDEELEQRAHEALGQGKYRDARNLLGLLVRRRRDPHLEASLELARGCLAHESGRGEEAARHFARACKLDPERKAAVRTLHAELEAQRKTNKSQGRLRRLLSRS